MAQRKENLTPSSPELLSRHTPRPFKDLEWHKGKKTRHRRHLSLLRQGPAEPLASRNLQRSPANAF